MSKRFEPPSINSRFSEARPTTYNAEARSVDAVLSTGADVKRSYGIEQLSIDARSVGLGRVHGGGIPLLDSHNQFEIGAALGRIERVWFAGGALMGRIRFNDTDEGRKAEGMVARGELTGISIGYRVDDWQVTDSDGNVIDLDRARWSDDELTFTATKWELLEASLVTVPADPSAAVRSLIAPPRRLGRKLVVAAIKARMRMRAALVRSRVRL